MTTASTGAWSQGYSILEYCCPHYDDEDERTSGTRSGRESCILFFSETKAQIEY